MYMLNYLFEAYLAQHWICCLSYPGDYRLSARGTVSFFGTFLLQNMLFAYSEVLYPHAGTLWSKGPC